ncbi:hypothetical protein HK097_010076 [Rhizophlyctis rosea]|uniref:Uncharacterized protein n=1 Tax=Rhizophlyctis rosea TaxID=64517 RepID=A0AAD5X427_9FUNG|nr:hypothetical protein HK097_010076 [Rhizophlyctis rosea]
MKPFVTLIVSSLLGIASTYPTRCPSRPRPSPNVNITVAYDEIYSDPSTPLTSVACSNGENGLKSKGYTTLSEVPSFPYLAASPFADWNSTEYASSDGFVVGKEALDDLTEGKAEEVGVVDVEWQNVDVWRCGGYDDKK